MKNKKIVLACASFLALSLSSYASAGAPPGAVSLRLADGYIFFAHKRDFQNTSTPTVELGYEFNEKWGTKLGATILNTDIKGNVPHSGVHGIIYTLDGVYKFDDHGNFEPYVLAGIGVTSFKAANTTDDPTNQANVNAGIGAQYFIDPVIALNAEAKDVYTMSGGKNDVMLTAGISFYFGGEKPAEPVLYKGAKN